MPTYEYRCKNCKKTFEKFQRITDAPLKRCIHCGGKAERLISAGAGLIFKGTGFYITDYKKSKPEAKSDSKAEKPKAKESKNEK